jgi:hypothetical protein
MQIGDLIIMVLVFSGAIAGISTFMLDLASHNSKSISDLSTLNQISAIQNQTKQFDTSMKTQITGIPLVDIPLVTIQGFIQFANLVGSSLYGFWFVLFNGIGSVIGVWLPWWFMPMIEAIVTTIIMFVVLSAIIKWKLA